MGRVPAAAHTRWQTVVAGGSIHVLTSVLRPPVVLKVSPSKVEEGEEPPAGGGGGIGGLLLLLLRGRQVGGLGGGPEVPGKLLGGASEVNGVEVTVLGGRALGGGAIEEDGGEVTVLVGTARRGLPELDIPVTIATVDAAAVAASSARRLETGGSSGEG